MNRLFAQTDALLRPTRQDAFAATWAMPVMIILAFAPIYGLFMGSFSVSSPVRSPMMLYAAVKMPLLLLATTGLCLPVFFVVNTIAGLRDDFAKATSAILTGQAVIGVTLASLGPITLVFYSATTNHNLAVLYNAFMFLLAAIAGQFITRRYYRPLIQKSRRHIPLLAGWGILYAFVGIQMGWIARPFIGTPGLPVRFVREDPFTNAYVALANMLSNAF